MNAALYHEYGPAGVGYCPQVYLNTYQITRATPESVLISSI